MSRFADVTSDTPHGPRPVPDGHIDADGIRHDKPATPSPTQKLLVLGAVGVAAAATTALGVIAVRALAGAIAGDSEDRPYRRTESRDYIERRDHLAPRFAGMESDERARVRSRARSEFQDYEDRAAEVRSAAMQERRGKERAARRRHRRDNQASFVGEFAANAVKFAASVPALITAANAAMDGLQQVSGRTDGIMKDFTQAADRLRDFLDTRSGDDVAHNKAGADQHGQAAAEPTAAADHKPTNRA
ncbi:hypothetical protein [Paracoccus xiamenensis]|uniref:hypothetical protein n=1 Tax=Paracoccus xiamenensis TaxID=2714901 RepID=UPI00140A558C|nr:hypothetical protein [Paracoccus xiamenensis]NHF74299.1 hypothetical protein [Paracoccus xiamenensis]